MPLERNQQVDELFHSALGREPAARSAFLREACGGDEELHCEVESLLAAYEEAGSLIERPVAAAAAHLLSDRQARSLVGQEVGHYQIIELIGAGGMGEVYLAEDRSLGRPVALKLLPALFTADKERVRRFQREARAVSSLNHPNILTIHEVGEAEGVHFIATEFVDGVTLRERITSGQVKLIEALDVAAQVASALSAAHDQGIVHRDIKPENVMLRRRDRIVKVLDFGLAKLTERQRPAADPEAAMERKLTTHPGMVMGTVTYMSPEQARGLEVDARTDLWSLGCVLFEMVAGRAPFEGETASDVIAAILEKEPPMVARYSREVPEALEWIVAKALRKDRDERYQTAKELLTDLRQLRQRLEFEAELGRSVQPETGDEAAESSNESAAITGRVAEARSTSSVEYLVGEIRGHKRGAVLALASLVVAVAAVAFGWYKFFNQTKPATVVPFQTIKMTRLTGTGKAMDAAISPDGKYVAYVEEGDKRQSLWVRQVAADSAVQLVPPAEVVYWGLTFSNDSNYVYYVKAEKAEKSQPPRVLYQVPALGGVSRKLIERADSAVTFSPDGERLAFVRYSFQPEVGTHFIN